MSIDIDTGGPVFPIDRDTVNLGMTLRDYFAASMVSSGHIFKVLNEGNTPDSVAAQAYALADAMLKAREQ